MSYLNILQVQGFVKDINAKYSVLKVGQPVQVITFFVKKVLCQKNGIKVLKIN